MGSVPEFSASVRKRRMIRRWAENAPKMSRNRGNVSDLLTGKIFPPLNAVGSRRGDENVPGGPPPKKILATPLGGPADFNKRQGREHLSDAAAAKFFFPKSSDRVII